MKWFVVLSLFATTQLALAGTPQPIDDGGEQIVIGQTGNFYCYSTCVSVCGQKEDFNTVASEVSFTARSTSDVGALNLAVGYCLQTLSNSKCPVKGPNTTATTTHAVSSYSASFRRGQKVLYSTTPLGLECVVQK